jgi:Na+/melibiose symporter-like transporter
MSLWRDREFLKLWTGQAVSQVGSRITRTALPFAAVIVLGATPWQMGLLSGASAGASLAVGLFAGAWVDRLKRKPLLIGADLARAAALAAVPLAAVEGWLSMPLLYIVAAISAVLTVLFDASYQAYVPSIVASDQLVSVNAKLALSESVAEVSGPGMAGFLVQALTAPVAVAFDAASFLVSAVSLALVRKTEPEPARTETHILAEIAAGLREIPRNAYLRALALRSATAFFFGGFMGSMYPLFTVKVLGLSPAAIGVVVSVGGAMAILGSAVTETIVKRFGFGRTFLWTAVFVGCTAFLHPLAHGPAWMACAFLAAGQLGDIGWPILTVSEMSLRQSVAPPRLLGRINSAMNLMFNGVLPIGSLAGGALAEAVGVRATMLAGAGGFLLSALWLLPIRHLRELPATNAATSGVT